MGWLKSALIILISGGLLMTAASNPQAETEAATGLTLAHDGKYESAIQHYRAAIALDAHLPGIYLNLGLAYFKLDRLSEAAAAFERATQADPGNFQARALLGMSYFGSRRFAAAAAQLKLAAAQQPDNVELRYKLAQSYLWSKQYQAAIGEFRFLLTKDPDSAPVHMLLGEVLDAANQEDQATAEFEAAVKAAPRDPEVHFGLAYLYWKQKRYPDAAREFDAVLAGQPRHASALAYLGDAEMHLNKPKEAGDHFRRALELQPDLRLAHLDLGMLLGTDDSTAALRHLQEAIRLDPSRPDAHYQLARLLLSLGRQDEANAEFAKVQDLAKEQAPAPLVDVSGKNGPDP